MKRFFLTIVIILSTSISFAALPFTKDIIVTSPDGIWTDARAYTTLNLAIDACGTDVRTITIPNEQAITTDTIPATITLRFERDGSIANSGQLTINTSKIEADSHQIFTGAGDIDFLDGTTVKTSWFADLGEALDVTSDDTVTMLISAAETTDADMAVGDDVTLRWESPFVITVDAGDTLSNVKNIEAGNYQILSGAGDIDFLDGTILKLNWFNRLRTVITWIETEDVELVINSNAAVDVNDTVQSNITLRFIPGGILTIGGGVELGGLKNIEAGDHQIFAGAGDIDFLAGAELKSAWFDKLSSATTWVEDEEVTILINEALTLDADVTTAANESIVIKNGGSIDGAFTATLNGSFEGAPECFGSSVTVAGLTYVEPEYWDIDGTADNIQLQKANDALTSGGTVQLAKTTYVVEVDQDITFVHANKVAIVPSSNVRWIGQGQDNTIIQLAANQSADSVDPMVFALDTEITDIEFSDFTIDLNGANNDVVVSISSAAIMFEYVSDVLIKNMTFKNCPGQTFVGLGLSSAAAVGTNATIDNCLFYEAALDADTNDHSCLYTQTENTKITNCRFINKSTNTNARLVATAWEFHASDCIAQGNTVTYFRRGCYLASNLIQDSTNQTVTNNIFTFISQQITQAFRQTVGVYALDNIIISNNIMHLFDYDSINGYAIRLDVTYDISNIQILNNYIYKTGGVDKNNFGVYINPGGTSVISGVKISENTFRNLTFAINMHPAAGTITDVHITGNTFKNLTPKTATLAIGIYSTGASSIGELNIHDNNFSDDRVTPLFDYAIYLLGTINHIDIGNNTYNNLAEKAYFEGVLAYTTRRIGGVWSYDVTAALSDTCVITITLADTTIRFSPEINLIGYLGADNNISKRIAVIGYLSANTLYDGAVSEIFAIGDALESDVTVGAPSAVGANNQITITITNANASHAFTGIVTISDFTMEILGIKSVTVTNS